MSIEAGTALPSLERVIRLVDMVAYAGATWDWHRLHYDGDYLKAHALEAPVVDGQMFGALLAEQVIDALGPYARIRTMEFRFRSMVYAGETVVVDGVVISRQDIGDHMRVRIEQTVRAADGRPVIEGAVTTAEMPW